jgi:hypothetical protein
MPKKLSLEEVKAYLKSVDLQLISENYTHNRISLKLKCLKCSEFFSQSLDLIKRGYIHPYCKYRNMRIKRNSTLVEIECKYEKCRNTFLPSKSSNVFCSRKCVVEWMKYSDDGRSECMKNGSKGGKLSTSNSRSLNEIYFADLCIDHFGIDNVLVNKPMFDGFDADVILHNHNVAIEWNGKWHYEKIKDGHNLKQVQSRDKVKKSIIEKKYGFDLYVIKDMGKHDKQFVKNQFDILIKHLSVKVEGSIPSNSF